MKNKFIFLFIIFIFFTFHSSAQDPQKAVQWKDDRTETQIFSAILNNDYIDEQFNNNNFAPLNISDKIDNPYIETIYNKEEKKFLKNISSNKINLNEFKKIVNDFTTIILMANRPNDFAITKTNEVKIDEFVLIGENKSVLQDQSDLEYITGNIDHISGSSLNILPGNNDLIIYILPKTKVNTIVVELYSSVDNSYRTKRFALKNISFNKN